MGGQPIILRKWQQGLELAKEPQTTLPIWVNIYNIPMEYWNAEGFSYIASAVGKPLHVHNMTASCQRISYARICVEVDATFELVKNFDIQIVDPISRLPELINIRVEYQWSPVRCAKCKKFGHDCAKIHKPQLKPTLVPKRDSNVQKQQNSGLSEGAWMVKAKGKFVPETGPSYAPSSAMVLANDTVSLVTNLDRSQPPRLNETTVETQEVEEGVPSTHAQFLTQMAQEPSPKRPMLDNLTSNTFAVLAEDNDDPGPHTVSEIPTGQHMNQTGQDAPTIPVSLSSKFDLNTTLSSKNNLADLVVFQAPQESTSTVSNDN